LKRVNEYDVRTNSVQRVTLVLFLAKKVTVKNVSLLCLVFMRLFWILISYQSCLRDPFFMFIIGQAAGYRSRLPIKESLGDC